MSPENFLSSSLWTARVKTYFKLMDVNGDGFLSPSDFDEIASRMLQIEGNQSKAEEIRELFRSLYQYIVAGGAAINSNTKVSEEEFLTNAAKAVTSVESPPEVARKKNEVFFDLIDTDNSGNISCDEYRKYLAIYSGREDLDMADQAFKSIDIDGDGLIDREEFIEGHIRYWFEDGSDQSFSPLPYGPLVTP
ncbi:MAG: hypothetical protein F6J96_27305 [Symploca sp. SIO1C2]|nr:hypothetical protein [Symploca sp. SIO1C2]